MNSVLRGTANVPLKWNQFFQYLTYGLDSRRWKSDTKESRIQYSQDVIFTASSERKLPSKHLKLGVVLKSATSSRKGAEILNRYEHFANYHAVKEIETELKFDATSEIQMKNQME